MSKYTTELRWVIEQTLDDLNLEHSESNWPHVFKVIGLDDYPIFDEGYRTELNTKIIRHYYTREIGAETVGRFRIFVRDAMHLIMPYYNQLYQSEVVAKGLEPLTDRKTGFTEHAWGTSDNSGSATSNDTSTGTTTDSVATNSTTDTSANSDTTNKGTSTTGKQNVYQDTPQSEMIPAQIKAMQYATNVTLDDENTATTGEDHNVSTSNSTTNGTSNGTTKTDYESNASSSSTGNASYDNHIERNDTGYTRPQAELLNLYRETFLNIDRDVVEDRELAQCFMTIW